MYSLLFCSSDLVSENLILSGVGLFLIITFIGAIGKLYGKFLFLQRAAVRTPPFSSLLVYSQRLSFCSTLHTILGAGVPILSALRMTRNSLSNVKFKEAVASSISSVYSGKGISVGLAEYSKIVGDDIVKSMSFGESTGALNTVLKDLRDEYEANLEYQIQIFKESINPVITGVIAIAVLFVLLALFLPMFNMSQAIVG